MPWKYWEYDWLYFFKSKWPLKLCGKVSPLFRDSRGAYTRILILIRAAQTLQITLDRKFDNKEVCRKADEFAFYGPTVSLKTGHLPSYLNMISCSCKYSLGWDVAPGETLFDTVKDQVCSLWMAMTLIATEAEHYELGLPTKNCNLEILGFWLYVDRKSFKTPT